MSYIMLVLSMFAIYASIAYLIMTIVYGNSYKKITFRFEQIVPTIHVGNYRRPTLSRDTKFIPIVGKSYYGCSVSK